MHVSSEFAYLCILVYSSYWSGKVGLLRKTYVSLECLIIIIICFVTKNARVCNGKLLIIIELRNYVIEAQALTGSAKDNVVIN